MNQALRIEINWAAMTQKQRVLYWLQNIGTITQDQGKDNLAIGRVAARIDELKKDGHKITTIHEEGTNRYGHKITYARYKLITEGELF